MNLTKPEDLLTISIARSVIGDGVIIRHPIRISNSVIMPNAVVEISHDLDSVVLDGEHSVYCPGLATSVAS